MFTTEALSIERYPLFFRSCSHGPAEEVGWFGLIDEDVIAGEYQRRTSYAPDSERRFLRKLSDQWSTLRNLDLNNAAVPESHEVAVAARELRPLFHIKSWIQNNREQFENFQPGIVSGARTLRLLLDVPNYVSNRGTHQHEKPYRYVACKRQGAIYLTCYKVHDNQPEAAAESARQDKLGTLLTTEGDICNREPRTSTVTYFFSVLGRTFDDIKVLYTQQIDCMDPSIPNPPDSYVKLMSAKHYRSSPTGLPFCPWREQNPFRAAWAKSFIGGCSQIVIGIRDDSVLERCELLQTKDIPDKANCSKSRSCLHWNKERNISFLKQFLELVQRTVKVNYDSAVYGFEVDLSKKDKVTIHTVEWGNESQGFEENSILRVWGGEEFWNG